MFLQLQDFDAENKLRILRNSNREVIAKASRAFPNCHLFEGFVEGFGLWLEAATPKKASYLAKRALKLGLRPLQQGDLEKTFFVPVSALDTVVSTFKIKKSQRKFCPKAA